MRMPIDEPNWHAPGPGRVPQPRPPVALLAVLLMPLAMGVAPAILLALAFLLEPGLSVAWIWPLAIGGVALAIPLAHLLAAGFLRRPNPLSRRTRPNGAGRTDRGG